MIIVILSYGERENQYTLDVLNHGTIGTSRKLSRYDVLFLLDALKEDYPNTKIMLAGSSQLGAIQDIFGDKYIPGDII